MKVLKRVPWSYVFTCEGCKSELEAEPVDVDFSRMGSFDEFEDTYTVKCEVCRRGHKLDEDIISDEVKNAARKRYYVK